MAWRRIGIWSTSAVSPWAARRWCLSRRPASRRVDGSARGTWDSGMTTRPRAPGPDRRLPQGQWRGRRHPAGPCRTQGLDPPALGRGHGTERRGCGQGRAGLGGPCPPAPSPFSDTYPKPKAMSVADMAEVIVAFREGDAASQRRRLRRGRGACRPRLSAARIPIAPGQPSHRRLRRRSGRTNEGFRWTSSRRSAPSGPSTSRCSCASPPATMSMAA